VNLSVGAHMSDAPIYHAEIIHI